VSQENVEIAKRGFEHFLVTGEPPWETLDEEVVIRDHDIRTLTITWDIRG
jgi:hypothetical protein